MTFRSTADLIEIVTAGGGLDLEASLRPTPDLIQIAAAAARGGGRIILRNLDLRPTGDLIQIGSAGKGRVIFAKV